MNSQVAEMTQDQEGISLLERARTLQASRQRQLTLAFLMLGSLSLVGFVAVQLAFGYPPIRFIAQSLAALTLGATLLTLRAGRPNVAAGMLIWGITLAVSMQALVAGGMHSPGLFAYAPLLIGGGMLLGLPQARWLLMVMTSVVLVLVWPSEMSGDQAWGWQPVAPAPPGLRAFVLLVFLLLSYIALRVFRRSHERDLEAISALNKGLAQSVETLREREKALLKAQEQVQGFHQVLERRVAARTEELSATVARLQLTQQNLVQAEKMAALGSLVAGVSHELNTPLGVALTSGSTAEAAAHDLLELLSRPGALRRSDLRLLAQRCQDSALLAQSAVHRAAQLVENFKGIAVDHATEQRRSFDLRQTLERLLDAVRPSLAGRALVLDLEVEEGIVLDSYPGALDQVVIELIRNAADHAFSADANTGDASSGRILIRAALKGPNTVDLCCQDDGRGMAPEKLRRIFEPFYTTRLGQGGSGLGLSVAFNLVVNVLQGSLSAESQEGQGSCLRLLIPRVVAEAAHPTRGT